MGRIITNKAHKQFTYDKVTDTSVCKICKVSIKVSSKLYKDNIRFFFIIVPVKVMCMETRTYPQVTTQYSQGSFFVSLTIVFTVWLST